MREEKLRRLEASLRDVRQLLETDECFEPRDMNRLTALSWAFIAAVSAWKRRHKRSSAPMCSHEDEESLSGPVGMI
jgi:hypothetical protein